MKIPPPIKATLLAMTLFFTNNKESIAQNAGGFNPNIHQQTTSSKTDINNDGLQDYQKMQNAPQEVKYYEGPNGAYRIAVAGNKVYGSHDKSNNFYQWPGEKRWAEDDQGIEVNTFHFEDGSELTIRGESIRMKGRTKYTEDLKPVAVPGLASFYATIKDPIPEGIGSTLEYDEATGSFTKIYKDTDKSHPVDLKKGHNNTYEGNDKGQYEVKNWPFRLEKTNANGQKIIFFLENKPDGTTSATPRREYSGPKG